MRPSKDTTGSQITAEQEFNIDASTVVNEGQVVQLVAGKVVAATVAQTTAILGSAAENHSGTSDAFNVRSDGKKIRVYPSPTQEFEAPAPILTATGGSTTTFIVNDASLATFADDDFNGGYIKLVEKATASTNTDAIGTVYEITDFVAATKVFTITAAGGAITVGDKFEIFPPSGFAKGNFDANIYKLVLSATAALAMRVSGHNLNKGTLYHDAVLHHFGNKKA